MNRPKLYLFIGAPGAGKTTTAAIIARTTGATHLWADNERHKLFGHPTHSQAESSYLYEKLNADTEQLLAVGKSVVFDTNFNFYSDRLKLAEIAKRYDAETIIVWMTTPLEISRERSVGSHERRNGYAIHMSGDQFDSIVAKLEPPHETETVIKVDGSQVDKDTIIKLLGLS